MENWRALFAPWILERGYDYFLDGHVAKIEKGDGGYTATVSGSEDYFVEINCRSDPFDDEFYMDCSCPYAEGGSNCKHMAAVLYAIEVSEDKKNNVFENEQSKSIKEKSAKVLEETIESLSPEVVKGELLKILREDENLRAGFLMKYYRDESSIKEYINSMKNTARRIRRECSDHHGFVDWRNASAYTSRLINEVISNLHDLVSDEVEEMQTVFDVSLFVLDLFATTDIDDDGDTQVVAGACIGLWERIVADNKNEEFGKYMFDELTKFCDKIGLGEYISEEIDDFISDNFNDGHFIVDRLEILDRRIERFENSDRWNGGYILSQSVMDRLSLMNELGKSKSESEEFKNKYWHLPSIREAKMREYEAVEDWAGLISLLDECKIIDKDLPGLVSKYSRKLVDVYVKIGGEEKARDELYTYVTRYSSGNVDAFRELKKFYHEVEWIDVREDIFKCLEEKHKDIKPLLAEEGLKGRLMYLLKERFDENRSMAKWFLPEIEKYEKYLRPDFEQELLDLFNEMIMKMAEHAGGRDHYKEIVAACRRMFAYTGGKERVQEMVEKWRVMYYNRPAMKQELQAL